MTPGLFDVPVLPGLGMRADLIDPAEERMLIDHIDATDLTPFRFQGRTGKRLTTSLGWSYDSRWVDLPRHRPCPTGRARSAIGQPALLISIPSI